MKNRTSLRVAGALFKDMAITSLWYLGIFAGVIIILQIFMTVLSEDTAALWEVAGYSTRIYLLVIGIVYPLTSLYHYIAAGVTRKQFAIGLFLAAVLLSCGFAVLNIPWQLMANHFSPLRVLTDAVYGAFWFVVGWGAALGFQLRRVHTAVLGILCAHALLWGSQALAALPVPPWAPLPMMACALCLVWLLLLQAVKRIAVNC